MEAGEVDSENIEGETTQDATNKDGNVIETTVTPSEPKAKRSRKTKVTVIHAATSQKVVDITQEENISLGVSSQQKTSIEVVLPPKESFIESA